MGTTNANSALGPRLGRFELQQLVAVSGDRGAVFAAVDVSGVLPQKYALTVLDTRRMVEVERDALFERWSTSSSLTHPALVPPIDRGGRRGVMYVVTSWLDGVDLEQLLERHEKTEGEPLTLRQVATIGAELGEVLGAIHEATDVSGARIGLVHGRIAMTRVFMMRSGNLRLLGFPGTPENMMVARPPLDAKAFSFMAPEQLRGERPDESTDVYALGLLVLSARLGRNPLERETLAGTEAAILAGVQWGEIRVEPLLRELLQKALELRPADRPRSARWLAAKLMQLGAGEPLRPSDWRVLLEDDFPRSQSTSHPIDEAAAQLAKVLVDEIRAAEGHLELDSATDDGSHNEATEEEEPPLPAPVPARAPVVPPPATRRPWLSAVALGLVVVGAILLGGSVVAMSSEPEAPAAAVVKQAPAPAPAAVTPAPPEPPAVVLAAVAAEAPVEPSPAPVEATPPSTPRPTEAALVAPVKGNGKIAIASDPPGVVYVDGVPVGTSPVAGHEVAPGEHTIEVRLGGHDTASRKVAVSSAEFQRVQFTLTPKASEVVAATGTLSIASDPPGVIYVDGNPVGTSPVTGQRVTAGKHTVDVRLGGHVTEHLDVVVESNKAHELNLTLQPK